ncbi:MAG: hypothetical protein JW728_07345 [Candidatus Aureabacteria bacterium]|nr:hypothetical protein [Candidatus Auribacterota bacterium]
MKILAAVFLSMLVFACPGLCSGLLNMERGLWVWHTSSVLDDETAASAFFDFVSAPHGNAAKKINVIYLSGPKSLKNQNFEKIRSFIKKANRAGIKIEYLAGDANWSYQHTTPLRILNSVITYNNSVSEDEKFYGIHWDIEGHVLSVFHKPEYQDKIKNGYIDLLRKCRETIRGSGVSLRLAADLPTFYDEKYFSEVLSYADCVVLMDYSDSFGRIISAAENALEAGNKKNRRVVIGVETQAPNAKYGVTPVITFAEEGYGKMDEVLDKVAVKLSREKSFGGVAIHYYASYRTMKEGGLKVASTKKYPELPPIGCVNNESIVVDGLVSKEEWGKNRPIILNDKKYVVYGKSTWMGVKDLSVLVGTAWDKRNLYIAMEVTDDVLMQDDREEILNIDHIELWIDSQFEKDRESPVADEDDFQFGFAPGDFTARSGRFIVWYPDVDEKKFGESIKYFFSRTDAGYNLEAAIPWSLIGVKNPKKGDKFRISVDPSDTDAISKTQETLMSTSPYRELANPCTFRVMELQ